MTLRELSGWEGCFLGDDVIACFVICLCRSANWPLMYDHGSALRITEISFMHWQNHCAPINNIYPWAKLHSSVLNECCWKEMKWHFNRMIRFKGFTFLKVSWMNNLERWFCSPMEFCARSAWSHITWILLVWQSYGLVPCVKRVWNNGCTNEAFIAMYVKIGFSPLDKLNGNLDLFYTSFTIFTPCYHNWNINM